MDGPFSISSPGTAKGVISVASINSPYYPAKVFEFNTFPGEYFCKFISLLTMYDYTDGFINIIQLICLHPLHSHFPMAI